MRRKTDNVGLAGPRVDGRPRGLKPATLLLLPLLLHCGCRQQQAPESNVVRHTVERGPLRFTVQAGPREVWIGDPVTVELVVQTPEGYAVQFPTEQAFGELAVRPGEASGPRPAPVGLVWRQTFTIEPLVSGSLEIPALTVKYVRAAAGSATQPAPENELVSDALTVEVRSALTEDDQPTRPRDVTGTLLPPKPPLKPWQWGVILGAVVAVVGGTWVICRLIRRRALHPPTPILPEVWALRALAELEAGDWFERGRTREYYYRLTEIVRSYIEKKFGLAAPEMTTEEFLRTLARDRAALPWDTDRLRAFLEACDLVKYAAFKPRREDAQAALAAARALVQATAVASSVGPPSPTSSDTPGGQAA